MKKYIFSFKSILIVIISLCLNLTANSYAGNAVPVESYAQFVDNLNERRFYIFNNEAVIEGEFSSDVWSGSNCYGVYTDDYTEIHCKEGGSLIVFHKPTVITATDPQDALLFSDFEVDGQSIFNELINEALLKENIIFTKYLPNFLGGATFTATSAFNGQAFDNNKNLIPSINVGFGVFEIDGGITYLSRIAFMENISDLNLKDFIALDFNPVIPDSLGATFMGIGIQLLALDNPGYINNSVDLEAIESTFTVLPNTNCPDEFIGEFSFDAKLENISELSFSGLAIEVETLTNGNLLLNTLDGFGGAGSTLLIPNENNFANGLLSQNESVGVHFQICLKNLNRFTFFVNVLGLAHK